MGGDIGVLVRVGVFSGLIHWLIKGINDPVEDVLLLDFERCIGRDFEVISLFDFERLRFKLLGLLGDVEHVRIVLFERRKLSWNEDERVKLAFELFRRSIEEKNKFKIKFKFENKFT